MSGEKFSLSWNEFGSNVANTYKSLLSDTSFADVTLVSDDRKHIKAHKVILSSSSKFFSKILHEHPHKDPLLFLKGIQHSDLLAIVKFIYLGQTEVAQDDLNNFMDAAKTLHVQGLLGNQKEDQDHNEYKAEIPNSNDLYSSLEDASNFELDIEQDYVESNEEFLPQFYPEQKTELKTPYFNRTDENTFSCDQCEYKTKYSHNLKTHRTSKHEGTKYDCENCDRNFSTKTNLRTHQYSKHEGKRYSCDQCSFESGHPTSLSQHKAKVHKYL